SACDAMTALLDHLLPGRLSKLNFLLDLLLLFTVLRLSSSPVALVVAGGLLWTLLAFTLRHYTHGAYEAPAVSQGATLSILAMTQIALLAGVALIAPQRASMSDAGAAAFTLWPAALLLRLALRPLAHREGPLDDVLVVGSGP